MGDNKTDFFLKKDYHFFKLENEELNNNKIFLWTYWNLNKYDIGKKNNSIEVFEIILSDGERLWSQNIKIKDISVYIKNIKEEDYYTLIKKALTYTKKDIEEKFIYSWNLKDDIANLTIKLEISNSNDDLQNNFQYLLGSIDLLQVKPENRKKIYQLIYEDTEKEYQKLKDENSFLITTNDSLQKIQNEFTEKMTMIIDDKNKLEEVYLLKFRELLNEKKRKIKNLMIVLKKKEEIIKKLNQDLLNIENTNSNLIENRNEESERSNLTVLGKRKKPNNVISDNSGDNENNKMDIDTDLKKQPIDNNNSNKPDDTNINKEKNKNAESNNKNINNNITNDSGSDSDSDFNTFNLIPDIKVRSYTGMNKVQSLSSSIDFPIISTPTKNNNDFATPTKTITESNKLFSSPIPIKKQDKLKDDSKDDNSTSDDDIDKLLKLI